MPEDAEPTATPATAAAVKRAAPESDTPSPVRAGEDWCGPGDKTNNDHLSSTGLRQKVEHGAKTQKQLRKEVKRLKLRVEKADSAKRQAEDKANRAREAQAAMEIRCKATLMFQDEADARGVGDFVTGIAKAFIDGKIEWDGFQKHLFDNCVRNTTGSRHNSYNDDFMNHMSILRDASSPEHMLRQLMLWMPSPEPSSTIHRFQTKHAAPQMGDEGLRTAGMQTFADRSEAYTSKLNDAGFAGGGREPGTPEAEAAHRASLSQNAVHLGQKYPRMLAKDWRLKSPDPGFIVKGDATNIKEELTERFTFNNASDEYEITLIGNHYVFADVRLPALDWVLTHEAKDEQQALMTSLVQTLLRIRNGREFQAQDAATEMARLQACLSDHVNTMAEHSAQMTCWADSLKVKLARKTQQIATIMAGVPPSASAVSTAPLVDVAAAVRSRRSHPALQQSLPGNTVEAWREVRGGHAERAVRRV